MVLKNLAFNYRYIRWGYVGKYDTTTRWIKFKNKIQKGGLSGRPLFQRNLQLVKYAYQQTRGNFLIIELVVYSVLKMLSKC